MNFDPDKHHRRSIRLRGYDYSQQGAYFVTVCTQGRITVFGEIAGNDMILNQAGQMIQRWWSELPSRFPAIEVDVYGVMPNHFHGIIITSADIDSTRP